MDEVQLVIQGKVDDWRLQRLCAYNICCAWVKDMPHICDFIPLAFDDEIARFDKEQADQAYYDWASAENARFWESQGMAIFNKASKN